MKKVFIMIAAAGLFAATGQAAEPTIAELQAQLLELSAKINQLETQQAEKIEEIEKKQKEIPGWVASTSIKGDLRYRYENREDDGSNAKDRQRIRGRIGVYGQVNDYIDYGVRLATGGSATSSNQTLGDDNDAFDIFLDRIYVDIHPQQLKGAHVVLGKMPQPWLGRTGLVWDSDLNPEGIAIVYSTNLNENLTLHANAGAFVVRDEEVDKTGSGSNSRLQSAQVAISGEINW